MIFYINTLSFTSSFRSERNGQFSVLSMSGTCTTSVMIPIAGIPSTSSLEHL